MRVGISLTWRVVVGFLLATALGLSFAPGATSSLAQIVAADRCCTFLPGPFEQNRGEIASFLNPSSAGAIHNVFSTSRGPDGRELFYSGTISPGNESPVSGTQYLQAGGYPFVCTIHPGMDGLLTVTDSGEAVPRPVVRASIARQSLRKVTRAGRLLVSIVSPTGAEGVSVAVRIGNRTVGSVASLALVPNRARTVGVRLSAKGRKLLKGKRSVAISGTAKVAFGSPSTARRVIR